MGIVGRSRSLAEPFPPPAESRRPVDWPRSELFCLFENFAVNRSKNEELLLLVLLVFLDSEILFIDLTLHYSVP